MAPNEVLPEISETIREFIERHRVSYEVLPHYVVLENRPPGANPTSRRIQAGFDIDVYGIKTSPESPPPPEYELAFEVLTRAAETILANTDDSCSIEVIPYASTVILDTRMHFQALGMLRITIKHSRGLDQPAGAAEQHALKEMEERLKRLGVRAGGMKA
jgi:hypothetical protein